jgi:hypothetical protein
MAFSVSQRSLGAAEPTISPRVFSMSSRTVPQKVNDFLVRRQNRLYCDACIQERLGLKWRQQVQLITATLAVTDSFKRCLGLCSTCHEVKQVVQAVARSNCYNLLATSLYAERHGRADVAAAGHS